MSSTLPTSNMYRTRAKIYFLASNPNAGATRCPRETSEQRRSCSLCNSLRRADASEPIKRARSRRASEESYAPVVLTDTACRLARRTHKDLLTCVLKPVFVLRIIARGTMLVHKFGETATTQLASPSESAHPPTSLPWMMDGIIYIRCQPVRRRGYRWR